MRRKGGLPIGAALVDAHGRLVVTGSNCFLCMTMYSKLMPCRTCAGAEGMLFP